MDVGRTLSTDAARRAATRPRLDQVPALIVGVARAFFADDGLTWAAGMAFYLVLSIPPLLIAIAALTQAITGRHDLTTGLLDQATRVIPGEGETVQRLAQGRESGFAVAGVLAVAWLLVSGSRVFGVLVGCLTALWDMPRKGTLVERQLLRLVLLAASLVLLAVASLAGALVADRPADSSVVGLAAWFVGAQLVPLLLVFGALTLLYRFVPPDRAGTAAAVAGALLATILLRIVEEAFLEIVAALPGWETVYGPLAGVALLMTWALAASISVVVGAELVIVLERPERLDPDGRGAPGEENRGSSKQ
ncbi:MAG TPA: YihY/virulence factor BrkB family protein [Candidatus Limnocylindrales bacterium]